MLDKRVLRQTDIKFRLISQDKIELSQVLFIGRGKRGAKYLDLTKSNDSSCLRVLIVEGQSRITRVRKFLEDNPNACIKLTASHSPIGLYNTEKLAERQIVKDKNGEIVWNNKKMTYCIYSLTPNPTDDRDLRGKEVYISRKLQKADQLERMHKVFLRKVEVKEDKLLFVKRNGDYSIKEKSSLNYARI